MIQIIVAQHCVLKFINVLYINSINVWETIQIGMQWVTLSQWKQSLRVSTMTYNVILFLFLAFKSVFFNAFE